MGKMPEMRIMGLVAIVATVVLGALLFGFWRGGWTEGDVKKMASAARETFAQVKENAEAAVQAATG